MGVLFVLISPVWGVSHSRSKEVAVESEVMARLSRIRDEGSDVVHRRRRAIKATRGSSERGLRQRMADRQIVIELRKELKKHEEANA